MIQQIIPCKHCGKPTAMLGTAQCDSCWEERRSGRVDVLEAALREAIDYVTLDSEYPLDMVNRWERAFPSAKDS